MTITHDRNLKAFFNTPKKGTSSEVRGRPDQVNIITSFYWVYFLEYISKIGHPETNSQTAENIISDSR